MRERSLPHLFVAAGRPRALWALAVLTLLSGFAMLPAMSAMADHGASLTAFEFAGGTGHSQEILMDWGEAGRSAAWWQLALDTLFLIGYGLLLAGAGAAVAARARRSGRPRLLRAAVVVAWFGPLAAVADLAQNISLGLILSGYVSQPWSRIAEVAGVVTITLVTLGLAFVLVGVLLTRPGSARRVAAGEAG
jgi:hypothetical protein